MTTAAPAARKLAPQARHGFWWIMDESPGGLGDPEFWIDEAAVDRLGRGDAAPAVTVTAGPGAIPGAGGTWIGAVIRFTRQAGLAAPVSYRITSRVYRHGCNSEQPYYVAILADRAGKRGTADG